MKATIRRQLNRGKRKIEKQLDQAVGGMEPRVAGVPEFSCPSPTYELSERVEAISCGGIGAIAEMAKCLGLPAMIDSQLAILKRARPYHESDHVLGIAYNALCGAKVLDDIEHRRNDIAYLKAIGARTIPDPTTAGDFCRRFDEMDVWTLMNCINAIRVQVWQKSSRNLTSETAKIDADGSIIPTLGECKEGMDLSFKGIWGYHPLVISLANTGEPLFIVNRSGSRPSHEGAASALDKSIQLCRQAGFKDILLRGDTDFTQTEHLDRWDDDNVRFVFGYDANKHFVRRAESLDDYQELVRKADQFFASADFKPRQKPLRIKAAIVFEREYFNQVLVAEDTTEFEHRPAKAKRSYRLIVVRKTIEQECGRVYLPNRFRYFFYVTNDRKMTQAEVVAESNQRCNQENLIAQLKGGGTRSLHAPLNSLLANWAYMVMSSLAWTLKAWMALLLPISPRWKDTHTKDQDRVLRMDFDTFLQSFILIPTQILRRGRQLIFRLLAWRPDLTIFFRFLDALKR